MAENTALWDTLGKTDPKHTKGFTRGGGFKGTAIKPIWSYRRMTEEFGACGVGWGVGEPTFQVVAGPEGEQLVYCTASIWHGTRENLVFGVGGDKAVGKNKFGLVTDDEAFKKAYTDAITNALKMIGVGADVHMGLYDDNKYVNTMREEFAEPANDAPKRVVGTNPKTGMRTAHSLKKETGPDTWDAFQTELLECQTTELLRKLTLSWAVIIERDKWPDNWKDLAREEIQKRREAILNPRQQSDFPGDPGYVNILDAG